MNECSSSFPLEWNSDKTGNLAKMQDLETNLKLFCLIFSLVSLLCSFLSIEVHIKAMIFIS